MIIKKFLNKIHISSYTIILVFLALLTGLFKEISIISIIVIIHEFGHFIMLNKYKWNISKINIYPFGGLIFLDDDIDKDLNEELIISIFGPLFQEILFLIVFILYKNNIISEYIFNLFKGYNITILIFNLLPIFPLDGSKIVNVFLNKIFNFRLSYIINMIISVVFLLIFIYLFKNDTSYFLIISFLIYQIIYCFKNRYYIYNKFILEKRLKKSNYIKYKKVNGIKNMYRNKKNLIRDTYYKTEYSYMNKK